MNKLELQGLAVRFGHGHNAITAVDGVNLIVPNGGTLGLVGESGSGKSTLGRAIVRLVEPASGRILLDGVDFAGTRGDRLKPLRHRVQMVFQDPCSSLNPRMTIGETIGEAIMIHQGMDRAAQAKEIARLLDLVTLDPSMAERYPHQFSGGQRQRIAIARALAVRPEVVILDEVTSSVDVSVQANILNLLSDLQRTLDLSYLFISHNLSVVRYVSDVVAVMYLGRIVECAPTEAIFRHPRHPYTRALINSAPRLVLGNIGSRERLSGEIPDPRRPPSGCRFHTRCPVMPLNDVEHRLCVEVDPHQVTGNGEHLVECHFPLTDGVSGRKPPGFRGGDM